MRAPRATFVGTLKFAGAKKLLLLLIPLEVHAPPVMPWEIKGKLMGPLPRHSNVLEKERSAIVTASTRRRNHGQFSPYHDDTYI
jgi:hypothetical protein